MTLNSIRQKCSDSGALGSVESSGVVVSSTFRNIELLMMEWLSL